MECFFCLSFIRMIDSLTGNSFHLHAFYDNKFYSNTSQSFLKNIYYSLISNSNESLLCIFNGVNLKIIKEVLEL